MTPLPQLHPPPLPSSSPTPPLTYSYILLKGEKRFTLFSPDQALHMHTHGSIRCPSFTHRFEPQTSNKFFSNASPPRHQPRACKRSN